MKLLSVRYLRDQAQQSFNRFPWVMIAAILAVSFANYCVEFASSSTNLFPFINGMLVAALGISLFFGIIIFAEKKKLSKKQKKVLEFIGLAILVGIYYTLPDGRSSQNTALPYYRFAIFCLCSHLLVSFMPYSKSKQTLDFWNYNKTLFIRTTIGLLFSLIIFVGIILALMAIHLLFEIEFEDEIFLQIFIFIIGIFNTWFFISGIPEDFKEIELENTFPRGLRIFSQFILLPLLTLYLLILYGYCIKIIINWNWPEGIVSYLIISVSSLGILALLLLYPYRNDKDEAWISTFSRFYYYLLLPLVLVLFLAIGIRISEYGITINRYLIVLLGIWLTFTCFYFILGFQNIKIIPSSLTLLLLLASFGPWGIFSVSENSQFNRLKSILSESNSLKDQKLRQEILWKTNRLPELEALENQNLNLSLDSTQKEEVKSIIRYLSEHHGLDKIDPWFSQDLHQIMLAIKNDPKGNRSIDQSRLYLETMGLDLSNKPYQKDYIIRAKLDRHSTQVSGYDYLSQFHLNQQDSITIYAGGKQFDLSFTKNRKGVRIQNGQDQVKLSIASLIEENQVLSASEEDTNISPNHLMIKSQDERYKLELHHIRYTRKQDKEVEINSLSGILLINQKERK
ncbi:DUF4153 domain-containing protein [Echinicola marina]|uniref:DUF4153 domain-containing protein n=1 Tax=Echinicola marina TaxID=2859768 RepID=UPI001CF6D279|nr:DUF4153 domain-containing protein [Echinicola marina]UCS95257.1 DUF4153 domain-containing protein [Echinicola marina]